MIIKLKHRTICLIFLFTLLSATALAQQLLQNEKFTYAPLFDNRVVLVKEIPLPSADVEKSFYIVKEWGKERYASAPLISNIRYDNIRKEIVIKSKIELLLPENENREREKVTMTYHLNVFIVKDKCVFEVKGISYKIKGVKKSLRAEDAITQSAIAKMTPQQELKVNIQKSTLFFFNELAASLQGILNAAK